MTFQLVDFDSVFTDSESDIDFTAERMDNLVEIDTALELDDEVLASFVEENKAKNTVNKTKSDLNMWYRWCEVVGETRKVENITDKTELNRLLSHFYMTVKKKDGSEYEPSTIKDCSRSIDRFLTKNCGKSFSILRDVEFSGSREVLASKAKFLRREHGMGRKPNRAQELSKEEINLMWEKGVLGSTTPRALLNTVWLNNSIFFGWRANEEHYKVRYGDVVFREAKGEQCAYYEWLVERGTKTRDGNNCPAQERLFDPKIWATGNERCPVKCLDEFLRRRPASMKLADSPFYIAVIENPATEIWYKDQRMGVKPLQNMLKNMSKSVGITKRVTNHSARRTMLRTLQHGGIDRYDICQLSGHRNPKSLDEYSSLSDQQQHQLASVLSNRVSGGHTAPQYPAIAQSTQSSSSVSKDATSYFGANSVFHGCSFSFNVPSILSPPPKRRKCIIYSSDEGSQEN